MRNLTHSSAKLVTLLVDAFLPAPKPEPEPEPVEKKNGIDNVDSLRLFLDTTLIVHKGYMLDLKSGDKSNHTGYLKAIRNQRLNKDYNIMPVEYWYNDDNKKLITFQGDLEAFYNDINKSYSFKVRGISKDSLLSGAWSSDKNNFELTMYNKANVESRSIWSWVAGAASTITAGVIGSAFITGDTSALGALASGYAEGTLTVSQLSIIEGNAVAQGIELPVFGECSVDEILAALELGAI